MDMLLDMIVLGVGGMGWAEAGLYHYLYFHQHILISCKFMYG